MKKNPKKKYSQRLVIYFLILVAVIGCEQIDIDRINKVATKNYGYSNNIYVIFSELLDFKTIDFTNFGHCLDTVNVLNENNVITEYEGTERQVFNDTLEELIHGKEYFYCSYMLSNGVFTFSESNSFIPIFQSESVNFTDIEITVLSPHSISFETSINGTGSFDINSYGYAFRNVTQNSDWFVFSSQGSYPVNYTETLSDLNTGDNYELKVFIEPENHEKVYSDEQSFTIYPLQVITGSYILLGSTSARIKGQIIQGTLPISDYGFCYSYITSNPDLNNEVVSLGSNVVTNFSADLNNLQHNITYYYRAYGMEENRITYGDVESFIIIE